MFVQMEMDSCFNCIKLPFYRAPLSSGVSFPKGAAYNEIETGNLLSIPSNDILGGL